MAFSVRAGCINWEEHSGSGQHEEGMCPHQGENFISWEAMFWFQI
jgi:hypothetical protein